MIKVNLALFMFLTTYIGARPSPIPFENCSNFSAIWSREWQVIDGVLYSIEPNNSGENNEDNSTEAEAEGQNE